MKYFKTFAPLIAIFAIGIGFVMITSPDAFTAGKNSAGLVMMMFGAGAVWIILELAALGKKEPQQSEQKKG